MEKLMFLTLDGVYGESEKERHSGEIEISGFTWDDKPHMGQVGIGAGNTVRKNLTVFKAFRKLIDSQPFGKDLIVFKPPDRSSSVLVCCVGNRPEFPYRRSGDRRDFGIGRSPSFGFS